MTVFLHLVISLFLVYLALELWMYWRPLLAAIRKVNVASLAPTSTTEAPMIYVISACRDGAACIPGLVKTVQNQKYPANRQRLLIVADNCSDGSAALARSLGAEVYERNDLTQAGKGKAISEVLERELRFEPVDMILVLDVDARLDPLVLQNAATYFRSGEPTALSGATFVKNPTQSLFTHVGGIIQALLRLHQEGRAMLGLDAALHGSHGYALSREALNRLQWRTTTGQIAEDMELRLRCTLQGIPIHYARDVAVYSDVTADARAVHDQRRRWNSTYLSLIPLYTSPLFKRWMGGDRKSFDALFGLLLLPSFANLFLYITLSVLVFSLWGAHHPHFRMYAVLAFFLWLADSAYFLRAFMALDIPLRKKEVMGFMAHLGIRALALAESVFFAHVKIWPPAPHEED